MQRFTTGAIKKVNHHCPLLLRPHIETLTQPPCDVFINHRGIDTKKTFAGLLYQYLRFQNLNPFLDSKNMKPGDRLFDQINTAIHGCKLGVAIFSPRYCDSIFCLHELALLMEMKKRVIPIFCDVKPSQLHGFLAKGKSCSSEDLKRYSWALEETRNTVGLTFDSSKEDWSELLQRASDAVFNNLVEIEEKNNPNYIVQNLN